MSEKFGTIEEISSLGVERDALAKGFPRAIVGGARIPYTPQDLASIITLLHSRPPKNYLALEGESQGGVNFIAEKFGIKPVRPFDELGELKDYRKRLREIDTVFDLISIDGRCLPMDAETIWKYIEGGKDSQEKTFGKGMPTNYGIPKLREGGFLICNMADEGTKALWYRLRFRYSKMYESPAAPQFVGLLHT